MAPSYIVKPSGGGDTPYAKNNVTTLNSNNFDNAFGSGLLTLTLRRR